MPASTRPAPLSGGGEGIDPLAEFRVTDVPVILGLLREMRDKAVQVSLVNGQGTSLLSSLWTVDPDRQRIAFTADELNPNVQRLLRGGAVQAVCYVESVKLQFQLHDLELVRSPQACALQCELPEAMYRLQRRDGYRVRPLERTSPTVHFQHPDIPARKMSLRVLDVSVGGCALLLPQGSPPLRTPYEVRSIRADLDADTRFNGALRLLHSSPLVGPEGEPLGRKLGCQWLRIDGTAQRALQRYIDLIQKRRRLLR